MKNFLKRFWFATIYPGWWYIFSLFLTLILLIIQIPLQSLTERVQENPVWVQENFLVILIILIGVLSAILLKLYTLWEICRLSYIGWRDYKKV